MTEEKRITEKKIAEKNTTQSSKRFFVGGIAVVVIAVVIYILIGASKQRDIKAESDQRAKEAAAGEPVRVVPVTPSEAAHTLTIPGEVRPYASVTLYSKTSGYLRKIAVDKGDDVKEGQFIASIESPETDKSYLAAEATSKNKRSISDRDQDLLKQGLMSAQDAAQALSDADAAEATLATIAEQRNYETIRAPFAGRVTARFADPGALVQSAASSQSSALPLVTISQENRLRIYIYLDQKDASFVHEGDSVQIRLLERPDLKIVATISRYTGEIDPKTRTLLAEIDLDNKDKAILPGSFVQVAIKIKSHPLLTMPSDALIIKGNNYFVATVNDSNRLHFQKIDIADNDGKVCQVISGLNPDDKVALGVGDALKDGDKVRVIK
ncbi:MAG TPA: efflux RND transporter periplasmic adaptor subunit [Candidatus Kapabacteria bacterium]|nr:efflux RND transporter periplasmic adaptor subunit [Candidatus Kapabacteria bacterium]